MKKDKNAVNVVDQWEIEKKKNDGDDGDELFTDLSFYCSVTKTSTCSELSRKQITIFRNENTAVIQKVKSITEVMLPLCAFVATRLQWVKELGFQQHTAGSLNTARKNTHTCTMPSNNQSLVCNKQTHEKLRICVFLHLVEVTELSCWGPEGGSVSGCFVEQGRGWLLIFSCLESMAGISWRTWMEKYFADN